MEPREAASEGSVQKLIEIFKFEIKMKRSDTKKSSNLPLTDANLATKTSELGKNTPVTRAFDKKRVWSMDHPKVSCFQILIAGNST